MVPEGSALIASGASVGATVAATTAVESEAAGTAVATDESTAGLVATSSSEAPQAMIAKSKLAMVPRMNTLFPAAGANFTQGYFTYYPRIVNVEGVMVIANPLANYRSILRFTHSNSSSEESK